MTARALLSPRGLRLADAEIPLYAGAAHYFRMARETWRDALLSLRGIGLRLVDTYVPWGVHELEPGRYDFSGRNDLGAFLDLVHELGLYAIVRPGPHINAELTYFGIPKRVIWDPACQARSPRGNPVVLPMLPRAFPVPSYASRAFQREVRGWFAALGPILGPRRYPDGPIVLAQVDNEGALYFRDGAYDQDYHEDALQDYRAFLVEKYGGTEGIGRAYGRDVATLSELTPPTRFDAKGRDELLRHLDWSEFHERVLAGAMDRFATMLREHAGLHGVPTMHNLPFGEETTALNPRRLARSVDLVAMDFYHRASPRDRKVILRRATHLAVHCEGRGVPAFAAEMGAGFPPFFPPLDEEDSVFTLVAALAYGLRGFSLYMAVARDRWIGAPIDERGRRRKLAHTYERLLGALERTGFSRLVRDAPVRLVTPWATRRLARVMHAFGPATGALFSVLGHGATERCLEDDFGTEAPIALETDRFLGLFEEALEARGVPYAHASGEDRAAVAEGARWLVCATTGGMHPALFRVLREAHARGAAVTLGPRAPERDQHFRDLATPFDVAGMRIAHGATPAEVDALVAEHITALGLHAYASDPDGVSVSVHRDAEGPKVVFVLNPQPSDVAAVVSVPDVTRAEDALSGAKIEVRDGALAVRVGPRSFVMLEVGR